MSVTVLVIVTSPALSDMLIPVPAEIVSVSVAPNVLLSAIIVLNVLVLAVKSVSR